jgi:hypothetical protein
MHLSSVDFPDPDGPIMAITSPVFTSRFTFFKTSTLLKDLKSFLIEIILVIDR